MNKNLVMPAYNHCILNTITSILKYYNVETSHNHLKFWIKNYLKNIKMLF